MGLYTECCGPIQHFETLHTLEVVFLVSIRNGLRNHHPDSLGHFSRR